MIEYIDLARAKSEALLNVYSLLKENIKSCNAKRRRQRKQPKNSKGHTFFVLFFAVVLHDDNVKLPETSELHVLWRRCCMWSCSLFFAAAHFYLGAR